jgi:hypothetical protein
MPVAEKISKMKFVGSGELEVDVSDFSRFVDSEEKSSVANVENCQLTRERVEAGIQVRVIPAVRFYSFND